MDLKTALSSQHCNDIGQNELIANQQNYTRLQDADIYCLYILCCIKCILSSPSPVLNPSPKSRSYIQVPNPKSKVQKKGTGTGNGTIILQSSPLILLKAIGAFRTLQLTCESRRYIIKIQNPATFY